jgi:hypothetical protein
MVEVLRVMPVMVVVTDPDEELELGAVGELLSPLHAVSRVAPTMRAMRRLVIALSCCR